MFPYSEHDYLQESEEMFAGMSEWDFVLLASAFIMFVPVLFLIPVVEKITGKDIIL